MKYHRTSGWFWVACGALVVAGIVCSTGRAEPLAKEFLNGLRERGYADMALEYLDRLEKNPRCPPELKRTLVFERGTTLVLAGRLERDPALQEAKFNEAQTMLKEFIAKNPKDPLVNTATDTLGNILLERARSKLDQAARPKNEAKKPQLLAQGRKFYDAASGVFQTRLADIKRKLLNPEIKGIDPKASDPKLLEKRDALRGAYVQAQLMSATILRMKAETYDKGSPEFKAGLKAAAEQYDDVYKKYRTRLAGLYARLYQANCYHQIGGKENTDEAIVLFEELLEQPYKAEPLRAFRTKVLRMALECWLDATPKKKDEPKNYMPAIQASAAWAADGRPNEDEDADWLAFRFWLARVYVADASARDDADDLKKKHKEEAVKLARHVAKYAGEYKKDAQTLLQEVGFIPKDGGKIDPEDFAEARSAGRDALDQVQLFRYNIDKLALQLPKATGDKKTQLQEQLKQLESDLAERQGDAVRYFRLALALADEDISLNDKNTIYYFLCYLYYKDSKYYDAAVIGEFLARHFPAGVGAKNCAKIAMASYLKLYKANESEDKDFEIRRAVDIADYIVKKWPTQPEAQEALATLIPFMIKLGRLDDAESYLQKIDENSPKRGESELSTGQAMWAKYLIGMQDIRNAEKAEAAGETVDKTKLPDQEKLDDVKKRAENTLANGIERMRQDAAVDATLAMAALSLAQIYVDTQQAAKAVELLEDENIGPKTLVEKGDAAAEKEAYKVETYKVALRAYIGALPTVSGPQEGEVMMTKAEGVMNALKKLMGGTPEGQRRLIGIYISLATDIEKQIERSAPQAKSALIKGFEVFLTRVGDATKDVKEMFWVAQTLYALAEGSDEGGLQLTPDAEHFYNKAITAYNKILNLAKTNEEITPEMVLQVQMRLATTQRRLGKYEDAIDLFEQILLKRNMMLNVQVEAAKTYQEWGAVWKPVVYDRAIMGGRTNENTKKYTIWGWGKIANQTAPKYEEDGNKYEEIFYEARYNLARCRYLKAKKEKTTEDRKKLFQLAKNDVALTYRFYPEIGGETWKTKFDGLLREIQKELNEKQLGLEGLGELEKGPAILKSAE